MNCYSNIDVRIRQAELEYALGREELQLLSLAEEIRGIQSRIDASLKTHNERAQTSLYFQIHNGVNMTLCAINANVGRFGISREDNGNGIYVDWAFDDEPLFRGDRIIEYNGKFIDPQSEEELRKLTNTNSTCELVVIRKRSSQQNLHMLQQSQEDNQRLQHRISYLEDQVKELQQSTTEIVNVPVQNHQIKQPFNQKGDHVTSISISSSNPHDNEPQIFQRGNFVATIIGGRAIQTSPPHQITTTVESLIGSSNSKQSNSNAKGKLNGHSKSDPQYNKNVRPQRSLLLQSQYQQYAPKIAESFSKQNDKHCKENNRMNGRTGFDMNYSHPDLLHEPSVS